MITTRAARPPVAILFGMPPLRLPPAARWPGQGGFTLAGTITSLVLLATAAAVCVPLVARRLRQRAPAAEEAARRVDAAVTRSLESVGSLADAYAGTAAAALRSATIGRPAAAALPDGPVGVPLYPGEPWVGPLDPPLSPPRWGPRPFFWKPVFARPVPWYFYRHMPWRAGGRLRR
jgi:hypothetical protein